MREKIVGWHLIAYKAKGPGESVQVSATRDGVFASMCSSSFADHLIASGYVAWELKNEWSGHVSSGY